MDRAERFVMGMVRRDGYYVAGVMGCQRRYAAALRLASRGALRVVVKEWIPGRPLAYCQPSSDAAGAS